MENNYLSVVYKILSAVEKMQSVEERDENMMLLNPEVLECTKEYRDEVVLRLIKVGYIDGVHVFRYADGQRKPHILWNASYPSLTHGGAIYLENDPLMKAEKAKARGYTID